MTALGIGAWALRNRRMVGAAVAAVAIVAALLWVRADLIQTGADRATTEARKANDDAIRRARDARDAAERGHIGGVLPPDNYRRD